jgi:hypothetical protein
MKKPLALLLLSLTLTSCSQEAGPLAAPTAPISASASAGSVELAYQRGWREAESGRWGAARLWWTQALSYAKDDPGLQLLAGSNPFQLLNVFDHARAVRDAGRGGHGSAVTARWHRSSFVVRGVALLDGQVSQQTGITGPMLPAEMIGRASLFGLIWA